MALFSSWGAFLILLVANVPMIAFFPYSSQHATCPSGVWDVFIHNGGKCISVDCFDLSCFKPLSSLPYMEVVNSNFRRIFVRHNNTVCLQPETALKFSKRPYLTRTGTFFCDLVKFVCDRVPPGTKRNKSVSMCILNQYLASC